MKQTQQDRTSTTRSLMLSVMALAFLIAFTLIVARSVLPRTEPALPKGELVLECPMNKNRVFSIWRVHADGTHLVQITSSSQDVKNPSWSLDGKWLAYNQNGSIFVIDADTEQIKTVVLGGEFSWLPEDRLWIYEEMGGRLFSIATGKDNAIARDLLWSPNATRMTYVVFSDTIRTAWIADADGRNARRIVEGLRPVWSPDSKRLAYFGGFRPDSSPFSESKWQAVEVQIADATNGAVRTLGRSDELLQKSTGNSEDITVGNLVWSPDSSMLALTMGYLSTPIVWILNADTGAVVAQRSNLSSADTNVTQSEQHWVSVSRRSWSSDSRYVAFGIMPVSSVQITLGILNIQSGQYRSLPAIKWWDWSPDGKWLALAQDKAGILLVTPDLSVQHRIVENLDCASVAWRPKR